MWPDQKGTGHILIFPGKKQEYFCALWWCTSFTRIFDMSSSPMLGSYMNIIPSRVSLVTSLSKIVGSSFFSGWPSWDVPGRYPVFEGERYILLSTQNHMISSQPWKYLFIQDSIRDAHISKIKLGSVGTDRFKQFMLLRIPFSLARTPPEMGIHSFPGQPVPAPLYPHSKIFFPSI